MISVCVAQRGWHASLNVFQKPLASCFGYWCLKPEMLFLGVLQKVHSKEEVDKGSHGPGLAASSPFKEGSVGIPWEHHQVGALLSEQSNGLWVSLCFSGITKRPPACTTWW